MASATLLQQISAMRKSMRQEKIINKYFVIEEEQLDKNEKPGFFEEIMDMYFSDSEIVIASMEKTLESSSVDFNILDMTLHRLKSGSVSIGAAKVALHIDQLWEYLEKCDVDGFKATVECLKIERDNLKEKLEHYFQLQKEARIAETAAHQK